MNGTAPKAIAFWTALSGIAFTDFVSKRVVESRLALHAPHDIVGEWFRMTLTYNTGAAMNISLGDFSRVGLSLIAGVMLVILYRMFRTLPSGDRWQALALGLVSGGALGNLLDRVRSGRGVVDFIDVGTAGWRFWTFNVADIGVVVGAVLLAIILMRHAPDRA